MSETTALSAQETQSPTAASHSTGAGGSTSAGSALRVQLRAADFSAGEGLLAPRAPVQRKPAAVQRAEDQSVDTNALGNDQLGESEVDSSETSSEESEESAPDQCSMTEDLGEMSTFAQALHALGGALDALAPAVGSGVNLSANVSITASGVDAKVAFGCSVTRSAAGLAGTITVSGSLGVGTQAATTSAYAALKLSNTLTVKGDTGGECADLAGLWVHTFLSSQPDSAWEYISAPALSAARVSGLGKLAADGLWGEGFPAAVLAEMDPASSGPEADTVSQTIGGGIEAAAKDTNPATAAGASGEATVKSTTTLGKDDAGNLTKSNAKSGSLTVAVSALGCSGSVTVDSATGWRIAVVVPIPAGAAGPAQAVIVAFAKVIDDAFSQLVTGKAVEKPTADTVVGVMTSWHAPITSALEESGIMKGSLEFAGAGTWDGKASLTVTKISSASLPAGSIGGGVAGVGVEAKAESKTVIISLP